MSAFHPSAITNNRETSSAQTRPVAEDNDGSDGHATGTLNLTCSGRGHATSDFAAGVAHGQNKPSVGRTEHSVGTNVAKEVNAAGAASASDIHQTGHKRKRALAPIAALVIGLASLGLRIAELIEG